MIYPISNGIKEWFVGLGQGGKMFVDWLNRLYNDRGKPERWYDADAPNDRVYYSLTASKVGYKDDTGTFHAFY